LIADLTVLRSGGWPSHLILLGRALPDVGRELAGTAKHGRDLNRPGTNAIDDPEWANDELAELRRADFRNDSTNFWKLDQSLWRKDKTMNNKLRVDPGVARNVVSDEFKIGGGARGPKKAPHTPMRRFRSSWGIPCPASS
jgi:hypothetical protein